MTEQNVVVVLAKHTRATHPDHGFITGEFEHCGATPCRLAQAVLDLHAENERLRGERWSVVATRNAALARAEAAEAEVERLRAGLRAIAERPLLPGPHSDRCVCSVHQARALIEQEDPVANLTDAEGWREQEET